MAVLKTQASSLFFRRLPPEIRSMVWQFARPEPRAIRMRWALDFSVTGSNALIPNLRHTCHESRAAALCWHKPPTSKYLKPSHGFRVFFNWSQDYLYLNCPDCLLRRPGECGKPTCGVYGHSEIEDIVTRVLIETIHLEDIFTALIMRLPACRNVLLVKPTSSIPGWGIELSRVTELAIQHQQDKETSLLQHTRITRRHSEILFICERQHGKDALGGT